MGRKSRRNRSIHHDPPRPKPVPMTREVLDTLLRDAKIERMRQSEIWEHIKQQHRGDPPARVCLQHLADRRENGRVMA